MTENGILLAASIAAWSLLCAALVLILAILAKALVRASGMARRADDRERRDLYQLFERVCERSTLSPSEAADRHGRERMHRADLENRLQAEVDGPAPNDRTSTRPDEEDGVDATDVLQALES